jgi:hypothetical protein
MLDFAMLIFQKWISRPFPRGSYEYSNDNVQKG